MFIVQQDIKLAIQQKMSLPKYLKVLIYVFFHTISLVISLKISSICGHLFLDEAIDSLLHFN